MRSWHGVVTKIAKQGKGAVVRIDSARKSFWCPSQ